MREVKKCIICLKPATSYSGHLVEFVGQAMNKSITAGFCSKHNKIRNPNAFGKTGCFGLYSKNFGVRSHDWC